MRVAISSLAWDPADDERVRSALVKRGITGIELAPMKYWPDPSGASSRNLTEYRTRWSDSGISIVALQGILFGKPELQLFGSEEQRAGLETFLGGMAALAGALGARVLVLGAPLNRRRGTLSDEEAIEAAAPLLRRVARAACEHDCVLCIEPNPPRYGGDFVTDTNEALRLVQAVGHPAFGLHLDAGALAINDEPDEQVLQAARAARHFHVSEVDLAPIGTGTVDHKHIGDLLRLARYDGWCSIEMRPVQTDVLAGVIDRALDVSLASYS